MPWPCCYLGGGNAWESNANIDRAWAGCAGTAGRSPVTRPVAVWELGACVPHERSDGSRPHGHPVPTATLSLLPPQTYCHVSPLRPHCPPVPIAPHPYPVPAIILSSVPPRSYFHRIPIATSSPLPPYCHSVPISIQSPPCCHLVPIVTPLPPCPCCHPILISALSLLPPCPHCHHFPRYYPIPIATPSPLLPHPHCHPIAPLSPLPPHPYFHPVPIITPSPLSPHRHPIPVATPLCLPLTGIPSRLLVPMPPDAATPCHTIMSLAECNGESSRCLCFSCSLHSCHFQ